MQNSFDHDCNENIPFSFSQFMPLVESMRNGAKKITMVSSMSFLHTSTATEKRTADKCNWGWDLFYPMAESHFCLNQKWKIILLTRVQKELVTSKCQNTAIAASVHLQMH